MEAVPRPGVISNSMDDVVGCDGIWMPPVIDFGTTPYEKQIEYHMDNLVKKRRKKMNKHKWRKNRKKQRFLRRKLKK